MERIFVEVLNRSIAAGWMILAVVALRLLIRKAPKWTSCLLWAVVAVRLVCPFSLESAFSLIPSRETVHSGAEGSEGNFVDSGIRFLDDAVNPAIRRSFDSAAVPGAGLDGAAGAGSGTGVNPGTGADSGAGAGPGTVIDTGTRTGVNPVECILSAAGIMWVVGMGVLALYSIASYVRLRRRVRTAVRLEESVYVSEFVDTPFVLGIVRPRIYLPADMPEEMRGPVLAHEQAHLRRRDNLWKMAGHVLRCAYWFHPLIWVAYALFCRDIELACDESVIKEYDAHKRRMYSEALLACSLDRRMALGYPLAFGEVGVRKRIEAVIQYKRPAFWAVVAAMAACIAVAICFLTDPVAPGEDSGDGLSLSVGEGGADRADSGSAGEDGNGANQGTVLDWQGGDSADESDGMGTEEDIALLEAFVNEWAQAFVNRDGNAIERLASQGVAEEFELDDMLSGPQGQRSFGLSSPWPEDADKDAAVYEIAPEYATILYYARTSEPHVTVWKERIFYRKQDGGYVVTREELTWLDDISTWKEYSEAYGYFGIDGTTMDYETNGLGEELNSKALLGSDKAYQDLFQPERAARRLLNLPEDASEVKLERIYEGPGEINFNVWFPGEEDSPRPLTMKQCYGREGIWIPKDRRVDVIARFRRIDWDEIRDRNMILVNEPGRWNHVVLIAELPEEGIRLYGYNDVEWSYQGVAVEIGEDVSYFDWEYTTDWHLLPECHWNEEKRQLQVALNSYVGHNAAAQSLHVLEYDDYGVLYESGWLEPEDMQEMLQDRIGYSILEETGQLRLFDKRDQTDLGTVDLGAYDAEGFGLELGMFSSFLLGEDIKLLVEPVYCQKDTFLVERPDDMPTLEVEILLRGGNGNRRLVDFGEIKCIPGSDEEMPDGDAMVQPYEVDIMDRLEKVDWDEIRRRNLPVNTEPGGWTDIICIGEIPEAGIRLYGYNDPEWSGEGVAIDIEGDVSCFDWIYTSPRSILPECYWNQEKRQLQVALRIYTGTGADAEELHVLQYDKDNVLRDYALELDELQEKLHERIEYYIGEDKKSLWLYDKRNRGRLGKMDISESENGAEGLVLELGMISSYSLGEDIKLLVEPGYCVEGSAIAEYPDDTPQLEVEVLLSERDGKIQLAYLGEFNRESESIEFIEYVE